MSLNYSEPIPNFIPCNECQAGQMHRKFVTYYTWLSDELITIPDFPAWVCDVCGRCEYDGTALNQLNLLLNPNAGKPSPRRRTTRTKTNIKPNQSHPPE